MENKKILIGLEREALRLTTLGEIDTSPHPSFLGDKLFNPYITTDFSESQLELITPPFQTNKEAHTCLKEILSFLVYKDPELLLHNQSMPPDAIAYPAKFGLKGREKEHYRAYLLKKYDLKMQLISGIHYNFSIENLTGDEYLHIIRNTIRFGFLFPFLFGNSSHHLHPFATSIRGSSKGYFPKFQQTLPINFNSKEGFLESLKNEKTLCSPNEYYLFIKPKFRNGEIKYIELRSIDIDPKTSTGISIETMNFSKQFLLKMLEIPSPLMSKDELFSCLSFHEKICLEGKREIFVEKVNKTLKELNLERPTHKPDSPLIPKHYPYLQKAIDSSLYKSMECSTQLLIKEALAQGIEIDIIDKETNTLMLSKKGLSQTISQATFTEKDSFISYRLQKDKHLTKKLLQKSHLSTATGKTFYREDLNLKNLVGKKICIKPNKANCGDGISIIKSDDLIEIKKAVDLAFSLSERIIVEDFFEGDEFRFFVIDGKEVFVCRRSPPKIIGDGISSVKALIEIEDKKRPIEFPIKYDGNRNKILSKGVNLLLRENSNVSTGGFAEDFTDSIDDSYKQIAKQAAQTMSSFLCGVDILIKDPHIKAGSKNYAILETNFNPALYLHEHPLFGGRKISRGIFKALGFECSTS